MLFSCYNITKCTLTTDRQIATTRARMVHGQTVHIWWNEWKASCLLLPPHFPYRNPFRRSFSFVLFSQEKEPSLDPSALNKCDIWCLYENDGRHHIDAVGWGRPLVRRQRPCIDSFIVVFATNSCLFLFFFYELNVGPGGLVLWDTGASEKPRLWDLSSIDYIDSVSIDNTFSRMFMLMVQTQIAYREKQHCERITDAW